MQPRQEVTEYANRTKFQMRHGLNIIPMYEENGSPNFSDILLAQLFRRIVREDTLDKIFYDGSIRNTNDFIQFFRNSEHEIYFVEYKGKEVGFFWLNSFKHKSAFINYCFYKEFWGDKALKISRLTIEFIFQRKDQHDEHLVDVLLGLTPASNKLAIKFLLKNGMTTIGKIPGLLYDASTGAIVDGILSYKQRQEKGTIKIPTFLFIN